MFNLVPDDWLLAHLRRVVLDDDDAAAALALFLLRLDKCSSLASPQTRSTSSHAPEANRVYKNCHKSSQVNNMPKRLRLSYVQAHALATLRWWVCAIYCS